MNDLIVARSWRGNGGLSDALGSGRRRCRLPHLSGHELTPIRSDKEKTRSFRSGPFCFCRLTIADGRGLIPLEDLIWSRSSQLNVLGKLSESDRVEVVEAKA